MARENDNGSDRFAVYQIPNRTGVYAVWDNEKENVGGRRGAFHEDKDGTVTPFTDLTAAEAYSASLNGEYGGWGKDNGISVQRSNYLKITRLAPEVVEGTYEHMRFQKESDTSWVTFQSLDESRYTLTLYHKQHNGLILNEADLSVVLDRERRTADVKVLERYPNKHDEVKDGVKDFRLQSELNGFLSRWLDDMERQGYKPADARLSEKELKEYGVTGYDNVTVYYNSGQKPFYTGYVHDNAGNVAVFNNLDHGGEYGGIKKIAHISPDRSIEYLESGIPPAVVKIIEDKALSEERGADISVVADEMGAEQNLNMIDGVINNEPPQAGEPQPELEVMPDPAIGLSERDLYGYKAAEVLPLLKERALELYDADYTVYMLYADNTEAMVFERGEISGHDGIFGVDAAEWSASKEYADMAAALGSGEAAREAGLLSGDKNLFGIYQLKGGAEKRDYRFEPLESLQGRGLSVDRSNYELVYTGELTVSDARASLNKIYETFNINRPEDFSGHSLSVSDVIVLRWQGAVTSHYVDDIGFEQLPSFLGVEAPLEEQRLEENTRQGEAEQPSLEPASQEQEKPPAKSDVQAGLTDTPGSGKDKPAAPESKKKPSILGQVEQNKRLIAQSGGAQKNAPNRGGKEKD